MANPDEPRGVTFGEGDGPAGGAVGGVPAVTLGTSGLQGSAGSFIRTDARLPVFDTTNPVTLDPAQAGSVGSAGSAARRDHRHAILVTDDATPAKNLAGAAESGTQALGSPSDHVHKSQSSGDFYAETTGKGLVTKDTQGTPRFWRMFAKEGATTPASGGVTITISSLGVITATRDGGAAGDVVIRIDDTGTVAP